MPELHDLSPIPGSRSNRKRVGRGPGSGKGKRAGRGQDGQKSRSGGAIRRDFEGGQMPLQRRIPKRGFKNFTRVEYQVVNLRDLNRMETGEVTPEGLHASGLIGTVKKPVKILGMGDLEGAYQVSAHAFSSSAQEKIEAAGGSVTVLDRRSEEDASSTTNSAAVAETADDQPAAAAEDASAVDEASEPEDQKA